MYQGKQSWNKWSKSKNLETFDSLLEPIEKCGCDEESE
jgi:hypothetical protein